MSDGLRQRRPYSSGQTSTSNSDNNEAASKVGKLIPRSKTLIVTTALFLIGIYIGGWAQAPAKVSSKMELKYNDKLMKADMVDGLHTARGEVRQAHQDVYNAKDWFWRFNSEKRARVERMNSRLSTALSKLKPLEEKRHQIILAAKHEVGVWSHYGVDETREAFWQTFQDGKDFAKRMTFWDVMFSVGRRDENGAALLARWVLRILSNYTMGMIYTLVAFMWRLWGIVASYTPNFASGLFFYFLSVFAALSVIGAFLLLLYTTCIGGIYMLVKNSGARVHRRGVQPNRNIGYQQQQYYDAD